MRLSTAENLYPQEQISKNEQIEQEQKEAKERFSDLIQKVENRYRSDKSTLDEKQSEAFVLHNEEILNLCIERGTEKDLSEKELKILEVAAILHDYSKADVPPEDLKDIDNYILAAHGEMASKETPNFVDEKVLINILGEGYSEIEKKEAIEAIQEAIRSHMGPHPGFMEGILSDVNKKLREKGMDKIEHPRPQKGDKVSETLLAADMCSLAGIEGRKKVLVIRSIVPDWKKEDEELSIEYKKQGIDLSPGEAALLSGFDSAEQARDMVPDSNDKEWINDIIKASRKEEYSHEGSVINYETANKKREQYKKIAEFEPKGPVGIEKA